MAKEYTGFRFSVPTLPAEVYKWMNTVRGELSHWEFVILAIQCLKHVREAQPEKYRELMGAWGFSDTAKKVAKAKLV